MSAQVYNVVDYGHTKLKSQHNKREYFSGEKNEFEFPAGHLFVCFCGCLLSKELGIPIRILPTSGAGVDGNASYQVNPGIQTNFLSPRPVQS